MSQLTPSQTRLQTQQAEFSGFDAVRKQSSALADHLEKLADNVDQLRNGAGVAASVLEHWQDVFRATHLAVAALAERKASTTDDVDPKQSRLVRVPASADPVL